MLDCQFIYWLIINRYRCCQVDNPEIAGLAHGINDVILCHLHSRTDFRNAEIQWRQEDTFENALLRRPKQPKVQGFVFAGWTLGIDGEIIDDLTWQDYIITDVPNGPDGKVLTFYAVFEPKE